MSAAHGVGPARQPTERRQDRPQHEHDEHQRQSRDHPDQERRSGRLVASRLGLAVDCGRGVSEEVVRVVGQGVEVGELGKQIVGSVTDLIRVVDQVGRLVAELQFVGCATACVVDPVQCTAFVGVQRRTERLHMGLVGRFGAGDGDTVGGRLHDFADQHSVEFAGAEHDVAQ